MKRILVICVWASACGCCLVGREQNGLTESRRQALSRVRQVALDVLAWGEGTYWGAEDVEELSNCVRTERPVFFEHSMKGWYTGRGSLSLQYDRRDYPFGPPRSRGRCGITMVHVDVANDFAKGAWGPVSGFSIYVDKVVVDRPDALGRDRERVETKRTCLSPMWSAGIEVGQ